MDNITAAYGLDIYDHYRRHSYLAFNCIGPNAHQLVERQGRSRLFAQFLC